MNQHSVKVRQLVYFLLKSGSLLLCMKVRVIFTALYCEHQMVIVNTKLHEEAQTTEKFDLLVRKTLYLSFRHLYTIERVFV